MAVFALFRKSKPMLARHLRRDMRCYYSRNFLQPPQGHDLLAIPQNLLAIPQITPPDKKEIWDI